MKVEVFEKENKKTCLH